MNITREQLKLYAVTDRSWLGSETLYEQVEKALKGGVTLVQLREKTLDEAAFEKEGQELLELCHHYNVPLIINDNVELAKKIHADGVHIGQSDMEIKNARELLGADKIIGEGSRSCRSRLSWKWSSFWNKHENRCKTDGIRIISGNL